MNDKNTTNEGARAAARLLKALATLLENASPDQLTALLNGHASVSSVSKGRAFRGDVPPSPGLPFSTVDLPALAKTLKSLYSRDEGLSLLASSSLTRRELEQLARVLKTPVLKTDNMERLTHKIIEAGIGSRLNSAAIRGSDGTYEP